MGKVSLAMGLALLLGAAPPQEKPSNPAFGFSRMEIYKVSKGTVGPIVADFNGDGLNDFAVANNEGSPRIEIFLQKSAAEHERDLKKPPKYDHVNEIHDDARFRKTLIPHEKRVFALAAGDLNGDGKVDLAFHGDPAGVEIYTVRGDTWKRSQLIRRVKGGRGQKSLAVADVNQDGRNDLVMLGIDNKQNESLYVFTQEADGRISKPTAFPTGLRGATSVTYVSSASGRGALVLQALGREDGVVVRYVDDGVIGPELRLKTSSLRAIQPRWTRRGLEILAVSSVSGRLYAQTVTRSTEAKSEFGSPARLYPLPRSTSSVGRDLAVGDVDGDGRQDILLSDPENATLEAYLQTQTPYSFRAPAVSATYAGTGNVQVGDFDGDGATDVLIVSPEEHVIGLARWEKDHLTFPRALPEIKGKPLCALVTDLGGGPGADLAYIYHEKGEWHAEIVFDFLTPKRKSVSKKLEFISENPTRLLTVDLDGDGDRDIAIIQPRDPFGLLLNHDGKEFEPMDSKAFGGKHLLSGVRDRSYNTATLRDGRSVILVAKKSFGRALALVKGKLEVVEQFPGGKGTRIVGVSAEAERAVLVDDTNKILHVLKRKGSDWTPVQEIAMPAKIGLRRVLQAGLVNALRPDLILFGDQGFVVLPADGVQTELTTQWTYESDTKEALLFMPAIGDLNADGRADLAVVDARNRTMELLMLPQKSGETPSRALRFEMFEEKTLTTGSVGTLRGLTAADLSGDGKDDLIFHAHDRILIYVQE